MVKKKQSNVIMDEMHKFQLSQTEAWKSIKSKYSEGNFFPPLTKQWKTFMPHHHGWTANLIDDLMDGRMNRCCLLTSSCFLNFLMNKSQSTYMKKKRKEKLSFRNQYHHEDAFAKSFYSKIFYKQKSKKKGIKGLKVKNCIMLDPQNYW